MNRTQAKAKALLAGATAMLLVTSLSPIQTSAATPHMKPAPAPMAAAQNEKLDFQLVNDTGYDISQVLVGASAESEWDPNDELLQGRTFNNGDALDITFSPKAHHDHWDLKVVYKIDGSSHEWDGLNLSEIHKITLHYNAGENSTKADIE
jgi:hypothetical protein